jgi:hypothetical protein
VVGRKGATARKWLGAINTTPTTSIHFTQALQSFTFNTRASNPFESAFIPFVSFGDLDNNTFKGLTSLLSVEQEIQYDEHMNSV